MNQVATVERAKAALEPPTGHVEDFDFLVGVWRVHHRQLVGRLVGSTTWREFGGVSTAWKIMGGLGNLDDNIIELPTGAYRAASLRTFDPVRRVWSIFWVDSRIARIDPPQVGGFDGPRGVFYGEDLHEGTPVAVRYIWTIEDADHCRWEQAFSTDGGLSWETNWMNWFERTA
jgi:hypothetical protein